MHKVNKETTLPYIKVTVLFKSKEYANIQRIIFVEIVCFKTARYVTTKIYYDINNDNPHMYFKGIVDCAV